LIRGLRKKSCQQVFLILLSLSELTFAYFCLVESGGMSDEYEIYRQNLTEIRQSREQAEMLRDQLTAEYRRLCEENAGEPEKFTGDSRRQQGLEAMRKAIAAADRAIDSINQALREMGGIPDEPV
jgi:hypothetical protein